METMAAARLNLLNWQRLCLAFCLACVALAAHAFEPPAFQGDVLDEAGLLSAEERATLTRRIAELRSQDGIWAAVLITGNLQGDGIETAAVKTFEHWRLGRADKDNGLLVLVAPKERKMRIEVGYGLEGVLTDVLSKRIVDGVYGPAFRDKRYADGLLAGFDVMSRSMQGDPATLAELSVGAGEQAAAIDGALFLAWLGAVWLGNLCVPLLYWLFRRRRGGAAGESAQKLRGALILFAFFGLFFGLFLGVFSQAFPADPEIVWALLGANALFALVFTLPLSFGGQAGGKATADTGWSAGSSSSSWDSGSSDSSSSGGGSSGGGGASGDY
ncbi:YgcG family protein [Azonexus sp.]|uniref:TPM domain-containing protein n=1 Tax=Azonexus sp. TaxID=1872668 RepID=UPI0035B0537C